MKKPLLLLTFTVLSFTFAQFPVTVSDLYGDVTLDEKPERVVALTDEMAEIVVGLGVEPVGFSSTRFEFELGEKAVDAGHLSPALDDATFVGGAEPSLEAIAALAPDLIVASTDDEAIISQLSEVAPTLTFALEKAGDWREVMKTLARATGRTEAAEAFLTRFDAEHAELREEVTDTVAAHPTVNLIYPEYRGGSEHFVFDETFGLSGNLSALGFEVIAPEEVEITQGYATLSTEAFGNLRADSVVSVGVGESKDNAVNQLLDAAVNNLAYVDIGLGRPAQGPLSDLFYMESFANAIRELYEN